MGSKGSLDVDDERCGAVGRGMRGDISRGIPDVVFAQLGPVGDGGRGGRVGAGWMGHCASTEIEEGGSICLNCRGMVGEGSTGLEVPFNGAFVLN